MKYAFIFLCLVSSTAMALAPQGEDFEGALRAKGEFQALASEASANGQEIVFENVSRNDISAEIGEACGVSSRGARMIAVRLVNANGWIVKSALFATPERARDLQICHVFGSL